MEINDLVDKHLTPDEEGQRFFVVTLKKKQGKYVSRENTNVNLINCNITEFTGNKGYSNISKSDVKFGQELKDSEFYIYDSYVDLGGVNLINCRGEFYNCWITGKANIDKFCHIKFKCCYFASCLLESYGDLLVESPHKRKSKVGYNEREIPDTDTQFNEGATNSEGKKVIFTIYEGKLVLYDIKDGNASNYFIWAEGKTDKCLIEISSAGILNVSGETAEDSVISVKNSILRIRQVGALLGGQASCLLGDNSKIDIDGIGEVITSEGKACEVNKCDLKMRNIGKIYPDAGQTNINIIEGSFDLYNIAFSGYTKTIQIDKSNGRIEKIGEFSTNGEAFVLTGGSKVFVKGIEKVKVGKDFIVLKEGSEMVLDKVDSYIQLPQNYCYLEDGSKFIGKNLGSLCEVEQNFIKSIGSEVSISDVTLGGVSQYVIYAEDSNKIWCNSIEGSGSNGIYDKDGSQIWIMDSDVTLDGEILINSESSTELYIKRSKITATSGDLKFEAGNILEITESSEVKCKSSSQIAGMDKIRISDSKLEAVEGGFDSIVSDILLMEDNSEINATGNITMTIADMKLNNSKITTTENVSIGSGTDIIMKNSEINATGDVSMTGVGLVMRDSDLKSANWSITDSTGSVWNSLFTGVGTLTNVNMVSKETSYGKITLVNSRFNSTNDTCGDSTCNGSYVEAFYTYFRKITISTAKSYSRFTGCVIGNGMTMDVDLEVESISSTLGTITGSGLLTGVLIGGSATIQVNGEYLLVGSGNSGSTASNPTMLSIGSDVPSTGNGVSVKDGEIKVMSEGVYCSVVNSPAKSIVLYVDENHSIEIGETDITITAKGGAVKNLTKA